MFDQYTELKQRLQKYDPQAVKSALELEACQNDWERWLEEHFWIKDKKGILRRMKPLKGPQKRLLKLYFWCREQELPIRIAVLKARKTGISTFIEALMFLETLTRGIDALVIAHDKPTAEYIFSITQRFYNKYDLPKPPLEHSSVRRMKFEGKEGLIMVETANNKQAGTGLTPQFIHSSETAKWQIGAETAIALYQSIGESPETCVILESTAYGFDALFQPTWANSEDHVKLTWDFEDNLQIDIKNRETWNGYLPFFIGWHDDPDYQMQFTNDAQRKHFMTTLDDYEKNLVRDYNLFPEQLYWRRWTINNKCQGDLKIFRQEYPLTPLEAFISTGRPYLDHDHLDLMPIEEGRTGYLTQHARWNKEIIFNRDKNEFLTIFRDPIPNHRYVIGLDTAEGILPEGVKDPDQSVAIVIDIDNGCEQVATICGFLGEDEIAKRVLMLGKYYNTAFIVPEVSGYGMHAAHIIGSEYPREMLYHRTGFLDDSPKRSRQIGWKTTVASRPMLLGDLKQAIADRALIVHDERTIKELKRLEWNDKGRIEAGTGSHDDHCFALGLAFQGLRAYPKHHGQFSQTTTAQQLYSPMHERLMDRGNDITGY